LQLKNKFQSCKLFIFEICSIKIYNLEHEGVSYQVKNDTITPHQQVTYKQDHQEILNDLQTIINLCPKDSKIFF